jgi:hypothetical protein
MQAVSVPRQITKRKIQPVDFVQGLRVKRSPYGASTRTIAPSTAIPSRKVVLRSLTETPKMRLEELSGDLPPLGHNPSSLQYKGKCITGAENLGQRTAVTIGHLPRS